MLIFYLLIALIGLIITVCEIHIRHQEKRRIVKNIRERGAKTFLLFPDGTLVEMEKSDEE